MLMHLLTLEEYVTSITARLEKECDVLFTQSIVYSKPGSPLKDWKPDSYNSLAGGFFVIPSNVVDHYFPARTLIR